MSRSAPDPYRGTDDRRECRRRRSRLASLVSSAPELGAAGVCSGLISYSLGAGLVVASTVSAIALASAASLPFIARRRVRRDESLVSEVNLDAAASGVKMLGLGAIGMVVATVSVVGVLVALLWLGAWFLAGILN